MKRRIFPHFMAICAATAVFGVYALPVSAAGPFDGTWKITAQSAGQELESGPACPAVHFSLDIKDNHVSGSLTYVSPVDRGVINSSSSTASPISGSVAPTGMFYADWMGLHGLGILSGDNGELHWVGECGPRVGMASRVK